MKDYLRLIDATTSPRYDITPLFGDHNAFLKLTEDLLAGFSPDSFDFIAGVDALGFVLASALATRASKGLILIRKGGKLPGETLSSEFTDYTGQRKSLEIRIDVVQSGKRYLVVDEWVETGAQVHAAVSLIEQRGGIIAGIATINFDDNDRTRELRQRYKCISVWDEACD